jgi:hypothetical protein
MQVPLRNRLYVVLLTYALLVAGCGSGVQPESRAIVQPDLVTATVIPIAPTATLMLGATPTVPADDCFNDAVFIEDVTIPDFTLVEPGERLDKRWLVQNNGTCDWGPGYRLVHLGVDEFSGPSELALYPAASGSSAELRVELVAPEEPGEYLSRWQAYSDEDVPFGQEIYLLVLIPTPTPEPTATSPSG